MRTVGSSLTLAVVSLVTLSGCGGSEAGPLCSSTASAGALTVNAAKYTCGSVSSLSENSYTFVAAATAQHTVELVVTSGNSNLCSPAINESDPTPVGVFCPVNIGPEYKVLVVAAQAGATYQVSVLGASPSASSYGIRVTSP